MHTWHKPICLEEPIRLWIYLPNFKSNQNWLLHIQEPPLKEREPENSKLQSYWNYPKVSFIPLTTKSHLTIFVWQSTAKETSHIFIACFLVVKIMLIYAKIQQLTYMWRMLQNVNLKIFCMACCHSMQKICQQNRIGMYVDIATYSWVHWVLKPS